MLTQLVTVREINAAVQANINGRNNGVYCQMSDRSVLRVNQARTQQGVVQVHTPSGWLVPVLVYVA